MTEETEATSAASAPPTSNGDDAKKKVERKKDETPIEELFDLSQPIPKVRMNLTTEVQKRNSLTVFTHIFRRLIGQIRQNTKANLQNLQLLSKSLRMDVRSFRTRSTRDSMEAAKRAVFRIYVVRCRPCALRRAL